MELNRADVERIAENIISSLKITVTRGDFTDPNTRIIELKYKDTVIDTASFNVVQRDEYEG